MRGRRDGSASVESARHSPDATMLRSEERETTRAKGVTPKVSHSPKRMDASPLETPTIAETIEGFRQQYHVADQVYKRRFDAYIRRLSQACDAVPLPEPIRFMESDGITTHEAASYSRVNQLWAIRLAKWEGDPPCRSAHVGLSVLHAILPATHLALLRHFPLSGSGSASPRASKQRKLQHDAMEVDEPSLEEQRALVDQEEEWFKEFERFVMAKRRPRLPTPPPSVSDKEATKAIPAKSGLMDENDTAMDVLSAKTDVHQPMEPKTPADPPATEEESEAKRKKRGQAAREEERLGIIQVRTVVNDDDPENMILLTGLKNIFQKQLPKMPKEYIARLVYDLAHVSVAIVRGGKDLHVVGGITYRPFVGRKFAEIVFCAISANEQIRGYGSHLMNHLKDHIRARGDGINYFLTYADNYAIGYFKKQGFTTDITLDRCVWSGYIKDYEGGTLMQCAMLPRVLYVEVADLILEQKESLQDRLRLISNHEKVYKGLTFPSDGRPIDPKSIPGLAEAGWYPEMELLERKATRSPLQVLLNQILNEFIGHGWSWPFMEPVNGDEVTDYYKVITEPMDFSTMFKKLEDNGYPTLSSFNLDIRRIITNCRRYNAPTTRYAKCAMSLERIWDKTIAVLAEKGWEMEDAPPPPASDAPKAGATQKAVDSAPPESRTGVAASAKPLAVQTTAPPPLHGYKGVHPSPTASTMMQVVGDTLHSTAKTKGEKNPRPDQQEEEEEEEEEDIDMAAEEENASQQV